MIEKLEYLIALAAEKNFSSAARICGVSQPSLSIGIKYLEKSLNAQLVERGHRFVALTAEGERALEWARRIIADARAMSQDIKGVKESLDGRIRMAIIPTALPVAMELLIKPLHACNPNLRVPIVSRSSEEIRRLLDEAGLDAAITYINDRSMEGRASIPLYREEYRLVTNRSFAKPFSDRPTWAELSDLPLCLMDAQNQPIAAALRDAGGALPDIALESASVSVLLSHIRTGCSVGILPDRLLRSREIEEEFRVLPIFQPTVSCAVGLVMSAREPTTVVTRTLAAQAREMAARTM
jgi:DNA-binding transcriptional LysR family regulator